MCPRLGPCHRLMAVVAVLSAVAVMAGGSIPVAAEAPAAYAPPVDAPVSDEFRPPPSPYAAGNRGIDYVVPPGTEVRASGDGEVTFAGQVGGTSHVVVLHADGLRTSYSFLTAVHVRRGDLVRRGAVVGTSGASLHLGVRAGERYVDPALLFGGGPVEVHLVPTGGTGPGSVGAERRGLLRSLAVAGLTGVDALRWLAGRGANLVRGTGRFVGATAAAVIDASVEVGRAALPVLRSAAEMLADVPGRLGRAAGRVVAVGHAMAALSAARRSLDELIADQRGCTPADVAVPPPPPERRIVVLVGGLGSSGGRAGVLDVRTDALGYDSADRVQFSYAGGRVPGVGQLGGVPVAGYGPADTHVDLQVSGARLRTLLTDIAAAQPGIPVDVVAHSQGGLVVREALRAPGAASPPVGRVVTLGTPHHGALAATIADELHLDDDSVVAEAVGRLSGGGVDPSAMSVQQMVEGSAYLTSLGHLPLPADVAFTSVAATGDLVVPATSSTLVGATNVVVSLGDTSAHARLPGSVAAAREIGLALRGAGPTCVSTPELVAAVVAATVVVGTERGVATAVEPGAVLVDGVADLVTSGPDAR